MSSITQNAPSSVRNATYSVNVYDVSSGVWKRYSKAGTESMPYANHLSVYELSDYSTAKGKLYSKRIITDTKTMNQWNSYRSAMGCALAISSGYRSVAHNYAIGGAGESQHSAGKAIDMVPYNGDTSLSTMYNTALSHWSWVENDHSSHVHGDARDTSSGYPTVQRGSLNVYVATCQDALTYRGYATSIDGVFGTNTESTVKSYQSAHGLSVDGVVGPNTWNSLMP